LMVTMMRRQQVKKAKTEPTMIRAGLVLDGVVAPWVGHEVMVGTQLAVLIVQCVKTS